MSTINTKRFSLAKDIKELLEIEGTSRWPDHLTSSDESIWKYSYKGDGDFIKFMNIYTEEIEAFSKYYPDMDIWMKNIYWDSIFEKISPLIQSILIGSKNGGKTLSIIHLYPIEMAIIGETIRSLGIHNVVYNFNRIPAVNSMSKTLEAGLFLVSWEHIDWLKEKMENLKKIIKATLIPELQDNFYIFSENDSTPNWDISRIDPYVKGAIGYKENIIIYRVGEVPEKEFLLQKDIKNITFFDTDTSTTIDAYARNTLGDIFTYKSISLDYSEGESIGYFESYVVSKNEEYLEYKKTILTETSQAQVLLQSEGGLEKKKGKAVVTSGINSYATSTPGISLKEALVYLSGLSLLLPSFLMMEMGGNSVSPTSTSGNNGIIIPTRGLNSFSRSSSWGSSVSSPSSSSSSKSSISSFGGGGFSKGGG